MRVPAHEIETAVLTRLTALFADGLMLTAQARLIVTPADIATLMARSLELQAELAARGSARFHDVVAQVRIHSSGLEIDCSSTVIAAAIGAVREPGSPNVFTISSDVTLTRSGRAMRLVHGNGTSLAATTNLSLINLLLKARRWWAQLRKGEVDIKTLGKIEGVMPAYITRVLRLAFLAPAVVDAILVGHVAVGVDATALTATGAIDALWSEQRLRMLPGG
jgi:site-specific DNA recombinase